MTACALGLQVDTRQLREGLSEAHRAETTAALMIAVAHDEGIDIDELASWYGWSADAVELMF